MRGKTNTFGERMKLVSTVKDIKNSLAGKRICWPILNCFEKFQSLNSRSSQVFSNDSCSVSRNRSSRSQIFFKIAVLKKFCNIYRKTPVKQSLEGLQLYWKESPTQMFFWEYCKIFNNNFFQRAPPVALSEKK